MSARFYQELSEWWPLFSPPQHYVEEVDDFLRRLAPLPPPGTRTLLELGSGGGSFASHLKRQFTLTLTDLSEGMLAQSRAVNPNAEHIAGDMRTLRLGREFDYVLVHDAVCYMTEQRDLQAAIDTAAIHCKHGGTVIVLPDFVKETFRPATDNGGEDAPDGRGFLRGIAGAAVTFRQERVGQIVIAPQQFVPGFDLPLGPLGGDAGLRRRVVKVVLVVEAGPIDLVAAQ